MITRVSSSGGGGWGEASPALLEKEKETKSREEEENERERERERGKGGKCVCFWCYDILDHKNHNTSVSLRYKILMDQVIGGMVHGA